MEPSLLLRLPVLGFRRMAALGRMRRIYFLACWLAVAMLQPIFFQILFLVVASGFPSDSDVNFRDAVHAGLE